MTSRTLLVLDSHQYPNWTNSIRHLTKKREWANEADLIADAYQWKKSTFETAHIYVTVMLHPPIGLRTNMGRPP